MRTESATRLVFCVINAGALLCALSACGKDEGPGLEEPIRVTPAVYTEGPLPGSVYDPDGGIAPTGPRVTAVESPSAIVVVGARGRTFQGRTTADAYAVAVALDELGAAHWVEPVGAPDPTAMGERTWTMNIDFASDLEPGIYDLNFVAVDSAGVAGVQSPYPLCIVPDYPDNLNACDPRLATPAVIVTLTWDTQSDVDLLVVTPDGKTVSAKAPSTVLDDGVIPPEALADPTTGIHLRDSNGACELDGLRRESVLWQEAPLPGLYLVYANLFDACGEPIAHFTATVWRRAMREDGTFTLARDDVKRGSLLPLAANGGARLGTYVAALTF